MNIYRYILYIGTYIKQYNFSSNCCTCKLQSIKRCEIPYPACKITLDLLTFCTSSLFLVMCCWAAVCGPAWVLVKIQAVITGHVWLEEHFTNSSINTAKASSIIITQSSFNICFFLKQHTILIDLIWQKWWNNAKSKVAPLQKRTEKHIIGKKNWLNVAWTFFDSKLWGRKVILLPFTEREALLSSLWQ